MHKKLLALLLALVMVFSMVPAALAADGDTLTIIATTDLHANIWGFAYEDNRDSTNNGMARVYSYIEEVRRENPNSILIDNGDTIQGTILSDDLYNKEEGEHPVISAMNFMGYDAMTLGNHEFNFGIGLIDRIAAQADFPLLSANTTYKADGSLLVGDYTIVEKNGIKIAIIGVTTPNVPRWDGDKVDALNFEDMSVAVGRCLDTIGDSADIIVVSAHAGMAAEYDEIGGGDGAQKIVDSYPQIDVLMIGHYHIVVNDRQNGTAIGGARNSGRDVVRFDVTLNADNSAKDVTVTVTDMVNYTSSEEIRSIPLVKAAHDRTVAFIYGGGAADGGEGGGVFGQASVTFQPANEILGIPEGKLRDTAVMDLINKVQLEASGADVSAAALFADTSDIKVGDINYGTIFGIYKFDNTLYRVKVTGAELKAYMEWSAECYNQWVPGDLSISFDPEYPGYLYDMFAGVDYEIDLSKPKGERIVNVVFQGKPLADDQELTLAVNNYRYSSALKTVGLVAGNREWESAAPIRTLLVDYITEKGVISPEVDNNWRIVGVDLEHEYRDELIALVNKGQLASPYAKSLNANALAAVIDMIDNVEVYGEKTTVDQIVVGGTVYYRLRDLAAAFNGGETQFNVDWADGKVVIVSGEAYEGAVLPLSGTNIGVVTTMPVVVDGEAGELPAVLSNGNYYIGIADAGFSG